MSLIEILLKAKPMIRESAVINALWIEGSYATGRFNAESDIDVWLDIPPGKQQQALSDFEKALCTVTKLREITSLRVYSDSPKLVKAKLYIDGESDDNRIELDMQESSRGYIFDRVLDDVVVLFDKVEVIKYGA